MIYYNQQLVIRSFKCHPSSFDYPLRKYNSSIAQKKKTIQRSASSFSLTMYYHTTVLINRVSKHINVHIQTKLAHRSKMSLIPRDTRYRIRNSSPVRLFSRFAVILDGKKKGFFQIHNSLYLL